MTRGFIFLKVLCLYLVVFYKGELRSVNRNTPFLVLRPNNSAGVNSSSGTEKWQTQGLAKLFLRPYGTSKNSIQLKNFGFVGNT